MLEGNPFADLVPSGTPGIISGPPETPKRGNLPQGWEYGPDGAPRPVPGLPSGFTDPPKDKGGKDPEAKATEEAAAGYYGRALNSHLLYGEGVAPLSLTRVLAIKALPVEARSSLLSPEERAAYNYIDEFIRAKLRKESGAAIPDSEMAQEYPVYFAQPNEGKADMERKRLIREQAIEGLRLAAGPAADDVKLTGGPKVGGGEILPSTAASIGEGGKLESKLALPEASRPGYDDIDFSGKEAPKNPFNPQQQAAYDAFTKANPGASVDQLRAFGQSIGVDINNAEDIIAARDKGAGVAPGSTAVSGEAEAYRLRQDQAMGKDSPAQTMLTSGMTLNLSDEAAGVGTGLAKLVTGQNPIEGYQLGRDAERLRIADARKQMGYGGTALEIAGGFLSANPEAVIRPATSALATITQGAKTGGGVGALAGFGSGEGFSDSAEKATIGGALGGVLGGGISALSTRAGSRLPDAALADAAAAEKVRISTPMYDRKAVNKAGMLEADPTSAPIIQQGFADTASDIGTGVGKLARGGNAQDRQSMGEMVRQAAKDIKTADKEAATKAYQAAEAIDGDPPIDLAAMRAKLDAEITRLQRTPGTNEDSIRALSRYRRDIDQPLPLSAVRDMRTALRDNISDAGLAASSGQKRADRRMLSIIEGTNDDLEKGLSKEGWAAWKEADTLYAQQQQYVKDALRPFVGKDFDQLPAETIFDRIKSAANSNGRALASLHRRLSPDQSRDIAATFAESLGKRGPDEEFSTALFISQARKFSNSARETIFGPSGASSFNNLLKLSRRLEQAKSQVNTSKTARPVINAVRQRMNTIIGGLMTGGGFMAAGPVGGGAGLVVGTAMVASAAARRALSAKALMNPRVSKWLLDGLDIQTEAQARNAAAKLSNIIAREPALAGELTPIQQSLSSQLTQPLAAEPGEDDQASQ